MTERDILPKGLKPVHYDLRLSDIDVEKLTFTGVVLIEYSVEKTVESVHLNARDLDIQKASVSTFSTKNESTIDVKRIDFDTVKQEVALVLDSPIDESCTKVIVTINYTGNIQTDMAGFYRSQYKDDRGNDAIMLSTQFEATDARRAFPCADEPGLKATFDVSITIRDDWVVIGNMPVLSSTTLGDGKKASASASSNLKVVKFETTPIMSTYLLAWAFGEFEYIEAFTERAYHGKKIPVRVYTTKGLSQQGQLALETAAKVIDYFSDIFEIDYALPKCDLLAVPEFSAGAMENWGLITYRTTTLLYDEATSDTSYRAVVLEVVAHELAHQWFGNLVTMSWWNELWLNEGYATYISWLAVDHLHPEWHVFSRFVTESLQGALSLDSLRTSHPIDVPVKSALDIDQIFDSISYLKGASVIRMISTQLTDKIFVKGVANYLKNHSYANATTLDLWAALSDVSGIDVNAAIGTWTLKIGFPLVTVTEKDNGDVVLRQDRFLSSGDVADDENKTIWWIPLSISSGANAKDTVEHVPTILDTREITIPGLAKQDFFLLNKNQTGVYRTAYSTERLNKISASIDRLSLSDKIGLLADTAACAISNVGSTDGLLSVISALDKETDYNLWTEIFQQLAAINSVWFEQPEEIKTGIQKLIQALISYNLNRLGWEFPDGEDYLTSELRSLIINGAITAGITSVIDVAKEKFLKWKNGDKKAIHPSLRGAVFRAALRYSTGAELKEAYETIFNEVINPSTVDSSEIALSSLGGVRESEFIDRGLNYILGNEIPSQDIATLVASISRNSAGRWKAWEFLQNNWDAIYKKYSSNMTILSPIITIVLRRFSSEKAYKEIEAFFADKDNQGYDRALAQSLDKIKTSSQWLERDGPVVKSWLKSHDYL